MNWNLGLNFYSSEILLFNPRDLDNKETRNLIKANKYHVYMVCKRKKLFFESSIIDGEYCKTILYYLTEKHDKVYLKYRHPKALTINSFEDGFYNIDFNGEKNKKIRDFMMIANFCYLEDDVIGDSVKEPLPSDLEVLYIGQAFGRTTLKTIDYRISHHEKVQKIALNILDSGGTEEILIIGLKIKKNDLATSIVPQKSNIKPPSIKELEDLAQKASKRITEGQEITVFEASLIKYFKPELNIEYKETFPSIDYPSYEEIYETDFNYCAMSIDTKPVFVRIFSKHVADRKYIHSQHYPLTNNFNKKTLFEYLYELNEGKN